MALPDLADRLAAAARDLSTEGVGSTLDKSVKIAVDMIDGCDAAGVSLALRGQRLDTVSWTTDWVKRGDELQYELGEGPCMDAAWREEIVSSPDLAGDDRWPAWGPRVVEEFGVRSMMCVQLFTDSNSLGALNMYSERVDGFTDGDDRHEALALGAHVAVALAAAQQIEHLKTGLGGRTVIGQAQGILMERFDLTPDRAFQVLTRVSSTSNTKLRAVAVDLVETRTLPSVGA